MNENALLARQRVTEHIFGEIVHYPHVPPSIHIADVHRYVFISFGESDLIERHKLIVPHIPSLVVADELNVGRNVQCNKRRGKIGVTISKKVKYGRRIGVIIVVASGQRKLLAVLLKLAFQLVKQGVEGLHLSL
jgi:hypothetical protein